MAKPRAGLILILLLPVLAGCGGPTYNLHAIEACAKQHPPPPEGNVERLGLVPVYLTRTSASDTPAMKQWYVTMDQCTASYRPPSANTGK
jgi:hypothetical protein